MYQDIFKALGLSPKETKVYEALLKLGQTSIKPLLRETGLKRGNLYDILYALEKRGLCEQVVVGKKIQFRPSHPAVLKDLAQMENERTMLAARELEGILPKLEAFYNLQAQKPYVTYFEGLEGLKKIHKLILKKRKPLKIFASYIDRQNQALRELVEKQSQKQRAMKIPHQALVPEESYKTDAEKQALQKELGIGIRKCSNFQLPAQIIIFGESVAISAFAPKLVTTYIENAAVAKTLAVLFHKLWEQAEET